jgi:EmrB/QacA subfamily drug resistance transporter
MTALVPLPVAPPARASSRRWWALVVLAASQLMVVLDGSIVNVALPSLGADLGLDGSGLAWVVNAYTLAFGGLLLLGGRLSDYLGRRRIFSAGVAVFTAASLLGGLAPTSEVLLAARALQGVGAALISPAALALVTSTFAEGRERNIALGVWGAVAGSGAALGSLLGGVLTETLSWRWTMFVNIPVGVAVLIALPALVAKSRTTRRSGYDLPGALTVTAGLAALVYGAVHAGEAGWLAPSTIAALAAALVLLTGFVVLELRGRAPLMPLTIFRAGQVGVANLLALLVGAALFSMFFFQSLYVQQVLGLSALATGLGYLPGAAAIIATSAMAARLVDRFGVRAVIATGLLVVAAGLLWYSGIDADGTYLIDVLGPSLIIGVGLGLTFVPLTVAGVTGVTAQDAGLASGLINTTQQIGGALGLAALAAVASATTTGTGATGATAGYAAALLAGAGLALLGALLALALRPTTAPGTAKKS